MAPRYNFYKKLRIFTGFLFLVLLKPVKMVGTHWLHGNDSILTAAILRAWCTFQIFGGCHGPKTGVAVTTVSNSLILEGLVTKVLKNGNKRLGGGGEGGWRGV